MFKRWLPPSDEEFQAYFFEQSGSTVAKEAVEAAKSGDLETYNRLLGQASEKELTEIITALNNTEIFRG